MKMNIPSNVAAVLRRLESRGYEAFIVGGCVRDVLLGLEPKDYDVTTNAKPDEIIGCFEEDHRVIGTGIKHGTVTVVSGGDNIEVTTYRVDGEYADHRRPESVEFASRLEDDLSRRDFTINAMAYSESRGLIDEFGGRDDLADRIVRCVGEPEKRFEEDALRIMRALRFASRLGFDIESGTAAAIHGQKELLNAISRERIMSELTQFITGAYTVRLMLEFSDVFSEMIPEIAPCIGFDQRSKYHAYDVWEHTARAVESSSNDRIVRLALLFHDIEKPSCCHIDREGRGHFPDHEKLGAQTAENIMKRLRFDNEAIKSVSTLIAYHSTEPSSDRVTVKKMISLLGFDTFIRLTEVMKGDNSAKQSFCLERVSVLNEMAALARDIIDKDECCTLKQLAVKGGDLESMGINGRELGETLNRLLALVIEERLPNEKNALLNAAADPVCQIRRRF